MFTVTLKMKYFGSPSTTKKEFHWLKKGDRRVSRWELRGGKPDTCWPHCCCRITDKLPQMCGQRRKPGQGKLKKQRGTWKRRVVTMRCCLNEGQMQFGNARNCLRSLSRACARRHRGSVMWSRSGPTPPESFYFSLVGIILQKKSDRSDLWSKSFCQAPSASAW